MSLGYVEDVSTHFYESFELNIMSLLCVLCSISLINTKTSGYLKQNWFDDNIKKMKLRLLSFH